MVNALKEKGLDDNTLIIYVGDQGYLLFDHKRFEKHTMWAPSIKSPLIIAGADHIHTGVKHPELIELIDIAPTICDALGLPAMPESEGKSFYPLLTDSPYQEKDYVFAEYLEDNKAMVANNKWKYVFTSGKRDLGQGYATGYGASGIVHRLYDLEDDPDETKNLASNQRYHDILLKMKVAMLDRFLDSHPEAPQVPDQLTLDGKLVWFCEPRDIGAEFGGFPLRIQYADSSSTD